MKHVIITGGGGFIGSHLCDAFLNRGYHVTAMDHFITGSRKNLSAAFNHPNFELLEHNVSRPIPLEKISHLKHGLHGVLHFACPASPVDFRKIPFDILEVDSVGTMHTVDLALKYNARYLLASTSECYGDPLVHPQPEDYFGNVNPVGPRACYDEAKRFAEAYVSSAMRGEGTYRGEPFTPLNAAIVRIFNTYGPRMRPDDGRIIPEFMNSAIQGRPLPVFGDGRQTRSFCYITDLVEGILALFESNHREVVNLGNPEEKSVLEIAEAVLAMLESASTLRFIAGRPDDPKQRRPVVEKAERLFGWKAKIPLNEGLRHTLNYFLEAP